MVNLILTTVINWYLVISDKLLESMLIKYLKSKLEVIRRDETGICIFIKEVHYGI